MNMQITETGNKPHESPVCTKIYAFKITTSTGYQSGRVEAHDHREAQQRASDSTPSTVLRGNIHLLADQDRARQEPYIALQPVAVPIMSTQNLIEQLGYDQAKSITDNAKDDATHWAKEGYFMSKWGVLYLATGINDRWDSVKRPWDDNWFDSDFINLSDLRSELQVYEAMLTHEGIGDMAIENMFQCSCKKCRREGRRYLHRCPNCLDLHNIYSNCKCPYPENEAYKKKALERVLKQMKVSRDANANKVIILACAHCGCQASVSVYKVDDAPWQAHIYCEGCGAQTGNDLDFLNPKPDDKRQVILDAINKWNKRTNHPENYGRIYNLETGCHE